MNLPTEHLSNLKQSLGGEFDAFAKANEEKAPVSIRVNSAKSSFGSAQYDKHLDSRDFVRWSVAEDDKVSWCDTGYYLSERPSFTHDPLFHAGYYYVQEASSQFLSHVAKTVFPKDVPLKVLDLCAAPGGKSTLLASELNDDSLLVSNEVIRTRSHILAENIAKWGKANCIVTNNDPEQFEKLRGFFDVIVVDAPCSGEGLFRRDPELTSEWSEDNVELCSARQKRIVMDIWPSLKNGGLLVYSTCTFNTKENEENLAWLKSQVSFGSVRLNVPEEWNIVTSSFGSAQYDTYLKQTPGSGLGNVSDRAEPRGDGEETIFSYRFYPHRLKGEGFFISVLRKTEEQASSTHKEKTLFPPAPSKERNEVSGWLKNPELFDFIRRGDHIIAIPKQHTDAVHRLSRTLNCVQYGIPVADAGKGMKPLHELALSVHLNKDAFHQTALTKEEALKFLAKEDFKVNDSHKGISLMMFEGVPLGWMNLLGNRANNLYPKEWRIRKL
jgi:16S rRNA C967 or C1407 C5-methylase (RsmB/RsmF family)/NOL1/NOP2/fmu family ribosome biogenesis protein